MNECIYCHEESEISVFGAELVADDNSGCFINLEFNHLIMVPDALSAESTPTLSKKINYCPMCGRKL